MPEFGWMRLAYSLLVLAALAAIVQLGSPSAATQPRTAEPPKKATAAVWSADEPERDEPAARAEPTNRPHLPAKTPGNVPGVKRSSPATELSVPPVFYRPSPAAPGLVPGVATGGEWEPGARRVCGDLAAFPSSSEVLFPLPKAHFGSYGNTWGAPRPQGGHEGTDLMVPTGTPEYAVTDGTIVPVAGSNENGWNSLGGYAVMLEASYSVGPIRKGDLFYYAHLERASDLEIGAKVQAGQVLGYAGDTGQGPEVTSGLFPPHLHFGWYDTSGARSALDSGAMNPFPLLRWIAANGGALRGGSDARYCEAPQKGVPKPSGGQDRWPAPKNPGTRPDLHAASPEPSPAAAKQPSRNPERHKAAEPDPDKPGARPPQEHGDAAGKKEPPAKPPPPGPHSEQTSPPEHPGSPVGGTPGKKDEPPRSGQPARDDAGGAGEPAPPDEKGEVPEDGGEPRSGQPGEERPGKEREEGSHPAPDPPDEHEDKDDKGKTKRDRDDKPSRESEEDEPDEDAETTVQETVGEETVPETTTAEPEASG